MPVRIRSFVQPAALSLPVFIFLLAAAAPTMAQEREGLLGGNIKYNSGQGIQPIFEGWTKIADGRYQLWFGYLNRNHAQEIHVPVGIENKFEPGNAERGQPTYFYPRFNRQLFSVTVPADFGKGQVIWTLVANGHSERAVGWLRPDWEIAPPGTGVGSGKLNESPDNKPPALTVSGPQRVAIREALTLTAAVTDDGLPPARPARGRGAGGGNNRPPAFDNPDFKATPPVNVPQVERPAPPRVEGRLQVSWFVWRGPAGVVFNPPAAGADKGKAEFSATFTKPGDYVLRARVTDGAATTTQDVSISVTGS